MAALIAFTPTSLNPVYNPIVFGLQLTDLGSGTLKKSLVYRILIIDNFNVTYYVTGYNEIRPFSATQIIEIDVSKDLQPFLNTAISYSNLSVPIIFEDKIIHAKFKIELYEKIVDTEICDAEINLSEVSPEFIAINSCVQDYEETISYLYIDFPQVLDNRPKSYWIDRLAKDRMWVWGPGSVTMTPNIGSSVTLNIPSGAQMVPMYAFGPFAAQMKYIDFAFNLGGNIITYRVHYKDMCKTGTNICFLNHMGGRCIVTFDEIIQTEVISEYKLVNKYSPKTIVSNNNNLLSRTNSGGRSVINKKSERWITLTKEFRNTDENYKFVVSMLASTGYLYFNDFGTQTKLILDNSFEPIVNDEVIIVKLRGYYSNLFISQNNDQ